MSDTNDRAQAFSYLMYKDLRDRQDSKEVLSGLIARFYLQVGISYAGQASQVWGEIVSGNYFNVLGVQPAFFYTRTSRAIRIHTIYAESNERFNLFLFANFYGSSGNRFDIKK